MLIADVYNGNGLNFPYWVVGDRYDSPSVTQYLPSTEGKTVAEIISRCKAADPANADAFEFARLMISRETAASAVAGTVPANLDEYALIGDLCARDSEPMTVGRGGVFLAVGRRLKAAGWVRGPVDLVPFLGQISSDEAFAAF